MGLCIFLWTSQGLKRSKVASPPVASAKVVMSSVFIVLTVKIVIRKGKACKPNEGLEKQFTQALVNGLERCRYARLKKRDAG